MLIHLWLIMLLIPSILCGDKGGRAKKKTAAPGKKAAKAAKAAKAILEAPAAAVAPVKSAQKRPQVIKAKKGGEAFQAPEFTSTTKKKVRIRNKTRSSTLPTTPRTRRTTMLKYFTQSWDEQAYGKLEEGILIIHNQNPKNVIIHEMTHFIEKDNQTIYEEKYLLLMIGHDIAPKEIGFHVHESEETKDRWTMFFEYLYKNYTIQEGVYYNLKKGDSKIPLYIVFDNAHKCVKIRQSAFGHIANATIKRV